MDQKSNQNVKGMAVLNATSGKWEPMVVSNAQAERIRIHNQFMAMVKNELNKGR